MNREIRQIQSALTPDLLKKEWREKNEASGNKWLGHCYVAAEALFHRLGGKTAGWKSYILNNALWPLGCKPGETHWFLKHDSGVIADPTSGQFEGKTIDYDNAKPCGFLTQKPSKRTRTLLGRVRRAIAKLR